MESGYDLGLQQVLMRSTEPGDTATNEDAVVPATPPLRRPRSPANKSPRSDTLSEKAETRTQLRGNQSNGDRYLDEKPRNQNEKPRNQIQARLNQSVTQDSIRNQDQRGDREDNSVPNKPAGASTRRLLPDDRPLRQPTIKPDLKPVEAAKPIPEAKAPVLRTEPVKINIARMATTRDVAPRRPLIPTSYVIEKLAIGSTFLAEVISLASACGSTQSGFVCLTLHADFGDVYNQLCDEFSALCQKDTEHYTPRIGETFAYLSPDDEGWYRARCLAPTRCALLDAGRVVSFTPTACRRLPKAYGSTPEFIAVLGAKELQIGANLCCTITTKSKVTVEDESGASLGDLEFGRWTPEVEYPIEPETPQVQPIEKQSPITPPVETSKMEPKRRVETSKTELKPRIGTPKVSETRAEPKAVKREVVPRKPLVPATYLVDKLAIGATFLAEVISLASACGSTQSGFVCLTLHADFGDVYNQLCDEFSALCQKDTEHYTPHIGETFAYLSPDDEGWYRARCLAPTRCALLDAGRVVSFTPSACRRLPKAYGSTPEFIAVLGAKELQIGANLSCTIITKSKVTVEDESGASLGDLEFGRWTPEVEYPIEPETPQVQPIEKQSPITPPVEPKRRVETSKTELKPRIGTPKVPEIRAEPKAVKQEVVPRKPLVPATYLVDKLAIGATFLAEVISLASACGSTQSGFVCLTLHADFGDVYNQLCDEFSALCQKDTEHYTPAIGETFAYLCPEEEGWYRARCLAPTCSALLDSGRVVSFTPALCRRLPKAYADIPEFVAVLNAQNLEIGANLSCTITGASKGAFLVTVTDEASSFGDVDVTRWTPLVEYPVEVVEAPPASKVPSTPPPAAGIPQVPRPRLENSTLYTLLDVTSLGKACVRVSDAETTAAFQSAIHDTVLYGHDAKPLTEPPQPGDTVVAKYLEDGVHYRALVKRVSVAKNKYLIEYIEFGNEEISSLDRLYPCPPKLRLEARPAVASFVRLSDRQPDGLTPAARLYIDTIKDDVDLVLTIPTGEKSAASGSLVNLLVSKSLEPASKKIEELCTPEWRLLLERGGDVLETESRSFKDVTYNPLPLGRTFKLCVVNSDLEALQGGVLCGYPTDDKKHDHLYEELYQQIEEYCNSSLCREPYLPGTEELCITKNEKDNKWVRSVIADVKSGASTASVVHIDTGELCIVRVSNIRKMLPSFVDAYPARAHHFEIKDFPGEVTRVQLERALSLAQRGVQAIASKLEDNIYSLSSPELIAALTG